MNRTRWDGSVEIVEKPLAFPWVAERNAVSPLVHPKKGVEVLPLLGMADEPVQWK